MPTTRFYHIPPQGKITNLPSISDALVSLNNGGYVWLDFFDPTKEDLYSLVEPLGLHQLSIEDCFDDDQVPKIEDFPTNTFILFNSYSYIDKTLYIDEIDLFLGKNFLITVNRNNTKSKKFFDKLENTVTQDLVDIKRGPDFLLHVILDYIVDEKFSAIEILEDELDEAEEMIIKEPLIFKPETLIYLRRHLLRLRKSLFHEREILVKLCRRDSPFIKEKAIYHFRDIYDHLAKFFEATEIYREMIASLMEMYLSIINNRMTMTANQTNQFIRRMTLIMTIFMPLTLLSGIGGMSEWSMMTGPQNWKFSYPAFLVLMVVVALTCYYILKWVEKKDLKSCSNKAGMLSDSNS